MYTDLCSILPITKDVNLGSETLGTAFQSQCRVEKEDQVRRVKGGIITYTRLFIIPSSVSIKEDDKIKILKISGKDVTDVYVKVSHVFPVGGFSPHHLEVYTK